jgi:hypothetical protein
LQKSLRGSEEKTSRSTSEMPSFCECDYSWEIELKLNKCEF